MLFVSEIPEFFSEIIPIDSYEERILINQI